MYDDPYKDFAERYDWMYQQNPSRETFFQNLFKQYEVTTVLDCACGTGKDLIIFHSLGCQVYGSDLSDAMLVQARKNLVEAKLNIPIFKIDYRELSHHFDVKFDAVVCLSNAINETFDDAETVKALQSMKALIRPGGILVFDQGQSDATMANPPRFAPAVNHRDSSRLFVMEYSRNIMNVEVYDFIHTAEVKDFKHGTFQVRIRLKDDWDRILDEAGFDNVQFYGDAVFTPYDKTTSKRLIAVAQV